MKKLGVAGLLTSIQIQDFFIMKHRGIQFKEFAGKFLKWRYIMNINEI